MSRPIIDSHIHWWDPSNSWMLMATQEQADELQMGEIGPMVRPYLPGDYRADARRHDVRKVVWVMATLDPGGHSSEVEWVKRAAGDDTLLAALIGSVDPNLPADERVAILDKQASDPRFRGVRVIGGMDYRSTRAAEYMRMLADRGFIYELLAHHDTLDDAAWLAERTPGVTWVIEHCGWPLHPDDDAYLEAWRRGLHRAASVENIHCKISGLAMSVHSFDVALQRPLMDACWEAFGPERCLFGSNFPVDRLYGSFDELMALYDAFAADLDEDARDRFFVANAEQVYGLE